MKIYLDTNVVLEFFIHRTQFSQVKDILEVAQQGKLEACMSPISLSTVVYLLGIHLKQNGIHEPQKRMEIRALLNDLLGYVHLIDISENFCKEAINDNSFKDIEDSLQYYCAYENRCTSLVTINLKHFPSFDKGIEILRPIEFVDKYLD